MQSYTNYDFSVDPVNSKLDLQNSNTYEKLDVPFMDTSFVDNLIGHLPILTASESMGEMYTLSFPHGISHTLMQLKRGGYSTTLVDESTHRIVGTASLHSATEIASLFQSFSLLSIATGQHYLSKINKELNIINQKIDKILSFLYGDKKAELLAEISFTQYAFSNFITIMGHESQKIATITSLQEARKIAMRDTEFYLNDLRDKCSKAASVGSIKEALRIYDSLNLSVELFKTSMILELFYSQNYDPSYTKYVEASISDYIEKHDKRVISCLTTILNISPNVFNKTSDIIKQDIPSLKRRVAKEIDTINARKISETQTLLSGLINSERKYILNTNGDIYLAKKP